MKNRGKKNVGKAVGEAIFEIVAEILITLLFFGAGFFVLKLFGADNDTAAEDMDATALLGIVALIIVISAIAYAIKLLKKLFCKKNKKTEEKGEEK